MGTGRGKTWGVGVGHGAARGTARKIGRGMRREARDGERDEVGVRATRTAALPAASLCRRQAA